ncbi:selenium-dependent molybdenum cofactor biosynthesis protein YqeB [Limisalsivibrio acetivorans]|uniref:selenium-dependent molybdenum cofactor biosynthesis protein YqeB n=1 Tax=Limisalsivibrio acetivorans TaxID=1304888 RepID=UPI00040C9732|nr:selenium-dependent molybdenum cofactor biosynthesis protein YqeB [Limisalsivibrio acetivorans]
MKDKNLTELTICLKGGGDLATGVALRLYHSGLKRIVILEADQPLAVRRTVCLSEAVNAGSHTVEDITSVRIDDVNDAEAVLAEAKIPVLRDPEWKSLKSLKPDVVIDAILAKRNLGTTMDEAPLVIGLGPGFTAGVDVHCVIETNRGHYLARVLWDGSAQANTGAPGAVKGYTVERVVWAEASGTFHTDKAIGDHVEAGESIGTLDNNIVTTEIKGVLRGLLPGGTRINKGTKIADIDPRDDAAYCGFVSEKSLAIGGGVLEAVLGSYTAQQQEKRRCL